MFEISIDDVRAALALPDFDAATAMLSMAPMGAPVRRADPPPRRAGVLALLTGSDGNLHIVLTRRTTRLNGHSGQMSFPGGRREETDIDFWHTALRETSEELGMDTDGVQRIGALTELYIPPSHFDVFPFVGYLHTLPPLNPCADEVASVYLAPLGALFDPRTRTTSLIDGPHGGYEVPAYRLCGQIVWGATAIMLCELEARLRLTLKSHSIQ